MNFKHLKLEVKEVTDAGEFTGYAAVFGNVDLGGDVIAPGAFAKTIQEKKDHPVLWGHNAREVIGVNKSYVEDAKGLYVHGQLVMGVQRADEARKLMQAGAVKGMSIGYDTVVDEYNSETQIRTLKELKLWEYSFTPFPMNPEAQLTGVKSLDDFESELKSITVFASKQKTPLSAEFKALIEQTISALQAAKAPEAATQHQFAPEILHAVGSLESILKG